MTAQHPITPPPHLRQLWVQQAHRMATQDPVAWQEHVTTQAARWGADMELEACCEWFIENHSWADIETADKLRAARRPKLKRCKQRALDALAQMEDQYLSAELAAEIRNALENFLMTDQQHPITIPPDLEEELLGLWPQEVLQRAAHWGADIELDACCEWVEREIGHGREWGAELRRHRRPQPKSLAEQALTEVGAFEGMGTCDLGIIRRALERLQELEGQSDG